MGVPTYFLIAWYSLGTKKCLFVFTCIYLMYVYTSRKLLSDDLMPHVAFYMWAYHLQLFTWNFQYKKGAETGEGAAVKSTWVPFPLSASEIPCHTKVVGIRGMYKVILWICKCLPCSTPE